MNEVRLCAMNAMDSMDNYLNTDNPTEKWANYDKLKENLALLSLFSGLSEEELYDTLSVTDLSNYNLDWLRNLQLKKAKRDGIEIKNKKKFFEKSWAYFAR